MADHYQNTISTWNKLATAYHEKFKDIRLYDDSYELFCSHLAKENPRILEIGCGPATATSWLKSRLPESKIRATDVSSEMIEEAKKHVKDVQFEVLDAREINIIEAKFDGIFSGFCIPYLTKEDLAPFIQSSSNLLLEKGIIYLSCIEDAYENSTTQTGSTGHSMAVHYYEESDLIALFEASQLEKIETIRVNYPLLTGENQVHLIVIGRKN